MVGYIDSIIKRQDKVNEFNSLETFQVETASRRALKELITYFERNLSDEKKYTESLGDKHDATERQT
jgi:hypothetical protein